MGGAGGVGGGVERVRREAHLAALRYDEERQKSKTKVPYYALTFAVFTILYSIL